MHIGDFVVIRGQLMRVVVCNIAEHVKAGGDQKRLRQPGMALCVHRRDVGLRVIDPLWNETPNEQQNAGSIYVTARSIFNTGASKEGHLGFRIDRHLQRELRTVLIAQLKTHRAGDVAAGRISTQPDTARVDAPLSGMIEQPPDHTFNFFHLRGSLVLRSQLVIDAVHLGTAAFGKQPHSSVELIQRTYNKAASVYVNQGTTFCLPRLGRVIYPYRKAAMRSIQHKVFYLPDRRLYFVNKSVMFDSLFVDWLMGPQYRSRFNKFRNFGIFYAAMHFRWNGLCVKNRHGWLPACGAWLLRV